MTLTNQQLTSIAQEFGTPVYVYHANTITQQYNNLSAAFAGQDVKIFYACKALTNINIIKHFWN